MVRYCRRGFSLAVTFSDISVLACDRGYLALNIAGGREWGGSNLTDRGALVGAFFSLVVRFLINGISVAQSSVKVLGSLSFVTVQTGDLILQVS